MPATDTTPFDHSDDHDQAAGILGALHAAADALRQLDARLRPLTGYINTHGAPADRVSMSTYNVPVITGAAALTPVQVAGNLPAGIAHSVTIHNHTTEAGHCFIAATSDGALHASSSYRLEAGETITLPVSSDVWITFPDVWGTDYTGAVSVMVLSWDAPR